MKVMFVTGSRWWTDRTKIAIEMDRLDPDLVIEGAAPGADRIAGSIARLRGAELEEYPAEWARYGKGAGPIRNKKMRERLEKLRDAGHEISCVGFHPDLAYSTGTKNMLKQLGQAGFEYKVVS